MEFEKTDKTYKDIPLYFSEQVGYYVKASDVPDHIRIKLKGVTCIGNENMETMVPLVDIQDIVQFGKPMD